MQQQLPDWEGDLVEEAIAEAERRLEGEKETAKKRQLQLDREKAYHRLAVEIDRPKRKKAGPGQLSFFPTDPQLFDDAG
ncbi:MAG TPA: hypothetical protein VE174_05020 [Actinomycetota bacterium]|jgi:hypothetical protein|nr:hypothetical protein [Actinomycetota bacterium]